MNFRVELPNQEVRQLIKEKNITRLLAHDQLLMSREKTVVTNQFHEAPITFLPTYKFDANCDNYDTSKKNRIPSWTDRILFCRDAQFKQWLLHDAHATDAQASLPVYYNRKMHYLSDHRPVLGIFKVQTIKLDQS